MDFKHQTLKLRFSLSKRIGMYEKLSAFLDADIDLVSSLKSIRDRYATKKDFRAIILTSWIDSLNHGRKLSESIAQWIPPSELMLIEAGERSGDLVKGLSEAVTLSMSAAQNKSAIIGGIAFPIALVFMLMGMLTMFQVKMVPIFKNLMPIKQWPSSAHLLNTISSFVYHEMWLVILIIVALGILITKTLGTWTKNPRPVFDHLPPWNIYKSYQASSFLIAFSSLMDAGIPAFDALKTINKNSSPWMRKHLNKMMSVMQLGGENMGRALDTGLLDDEVAGDIQDYSRLGSSFTKAIHIMGQRTLEHGIKVIKQRMNVIKNLLLVAVAGSIIWIYVASYMLQTTIADSFSAMH